MPRKGSRKEPTDAQIQKWAENKKEKINLLSPENPYNNFVYYNRLETDFKRFYEDWYNEVKNYLSQTVGNFNLENNSFFVRQLAANEEKKERAAIQKMFQGEINVDPENMNTEQLVRCINMLVGDTDIFERNLALILEMGEQDEVVNKKGEIVSKGGQKGLPAWFASYLVKAWNESTDKIANDFIKLIDKVSLQEALQTAMDKNIPYIIDLAIEKMVNADVESGIKKNREKYLDAYKIVTQELHRLKAAGNDYINQIVDIFQLQDFSKELAQQLVENFNSVGNLTKDDFLIDKKFSKDGNLWSTAGQFKEVFATMVANILSGVHINKSSGSLKLEGDIADSENYRMGGAGTRVDMTYAYGIKGIQKQIQQLGLDPSKIGSVKNAITFMENLKKYKDSLIVFVSSKDYTLNAGFRRRGGYEATTMTPESLNATLQEAGINRPDLIFSILQLCHGAVGSDGIFQRNIEHEIAQYFAYIFFDDVRTIGEDLANSNSGMAMHLMYLNGIYIPLSVFLNKLASAIEMQNKQGRGINATVKITIKPVNILFPRTNTHNTYDDWQLQREDALNAIQIYVQFLSNMRSFINNIFT